LLLVERLFFDRPVLYGSIRFIICGLLRDWEDAGAIATARLNEIERDLSGPLIAAVDAEFEPASILVEKLNALHRAWWAL
jgi:hypothetical protein